MQDAVLKQKQAQAEYDILCRDVKYGISLAAQYEQLAEETAELSAAASKVARILRGENPSPKSISIALAEVTEETGDVENVVATIGI